VSEALRAAGIDEVVVHTGQHYDAELSQVFFDDLGLAEPAHRLDLRTADVATIEAAVAPVLAEERPDAVLVFGDTNSTLAGARAAKAAGIRIAHVEAGLRSGDPSMPEEGNRIEVDRLAALLLCPDERSRRILVAERVNGEAEVVGDVMADACFRLAPLARERSTALDRFALEPGGYVLATVHREANVRPDALARVVEGLNRLAEPVVFPAHPRTRETIERNTLPLGPNVRLVEPLGYLDFAALASQARVIVTDSGGLQKEAYWYGVPCVTARPSTEWVDTVLVGANVLVDGSPDALAAAVARAAMPADPPPLYGDGRASERVARALLSTLSGR
jgi:UDP-N-acetylglucosamine 2-epimerase (non-hydrolysing)/UDP-GlcNAc3NAcA epimerase